MKFLVPIDLSSLEILNVRIQNLVSPPQTNNNSQGLIYYDTAAKAIKVFDGNTWVPLDARLLPAGSLPINLLSVNPLDRSLHTGSQLASTISDFNTAVDNRLVNINISNFQITQPLNLNNQEITNLGPPTTANSAVRKLDLDNAILGLDAKESVKVATTVNITLSGSQIIDGFPASNGDRVLVKNQADPVLNGIYIASNTNWTRSSDATNGRLTPQSYVFVEQGIQNAGTQWKISNTGAVSVGLSPITWTQFNGQANQNTLVAGDGILISNNNISVKLDANSGLSLSPNGLKIANTASTNKFSSMIGNGTNTTFQVTHNLGTEDVIVSVRQNTGQKEAIFTDWRVVDANKIELSFAFAPALNEYKVVIV